MQIRMAFRKGPGHRRKGAGTEGQGMAMPGVSTKPGPIQEPPLSRSARAPKALCVDSGLGLPATDWPPAAR